MTLEDRYAALTAVAEFRGLPRNALAALAASMREESFDAGETVIAAGETADRVFVLCQGTLDVTPAWGGSPVRRLGRGTLLGELAFFAESTRTATVRAVESSTMLSLPFENFRAFLLTYPQSTLLLTRRIAATLRDLEQSLAERR